MMQEHGWGLPPLAALRAFEATARLGGVTAAAAALGVTQSAVSRQVIALERWLGLPLFLRRHRRLDLPAAGRRLAATAREAFERLAVAAAELRSDGRELALVVSPSFAVRWLMPRLDRFFARHPRLELRLVARERPLVTANLALEGAIDYARGDALPAGASALLEDSSVAVASPGYLAAAPQLETPADLRRHRLLLATEDDWDWRAWAEAAGASLPRAARGYRLLTDELAVQAALSGSGLALMTRALVADELASGRLVVPRPLPAATLGYYYLRPPGDPVAGQRFQPLACWLLEEAGTDRAAMPLRGGAPARRRA
jgi:LysR family glycine cleavage system transcriptional activator